MGNFSFTPKFVPPVKSQASIVGSEFSKEHVPSEFARMGSVGIVTSNMKCHQSRKNAPNVFVSRLYLPQTKYNETFLTRDLAPKK